MGEHTHDRAAGAGASRTDPAAIAALLGELAAASSGAPADNRRLAGLLTDRFGGRQLAIGADLALADAVGALWSRGWSPRDVVEVTTRKVGPSARVLTLDVLAADASRRPRGDRGHDAELGVLGASAWWEPSRPLVEQWSTGRGLPASDALRSAIALVRVLRTLPPLPVIDGSHGGPGGAPPGVDDKVLARVRGLLAKAESTSFPEEAEALSAKAQELMGRHALERAMLDPAPGSDPRAGARRLWLDAPYTAAKSSLVHQVATPNRCRAVSVDALDMVTVVGADADLATVELLVTSLLVQADRAMLLASRAAGTDRSRTRSFRHAFLLAYATRVGERLTEAAHEAEVRARAEVGEGLLPVLAARADAVDRTVTELFPRVTKRRFSVANGAGWVAGRAAADTASLTAERSAVRG